MFDAIPLEMRAFAQWICWRYEENQSDKPTKVPYSPLTHRLASVTDPQTWGTFDQAVHAATANDWYSGIGFVLTDADPFAFIDLDDTKGDQKALERQLKIFNDFDSYAEKSPSGNGLHIIVKGGVPAGRRRTFVEVYSSQRYMTMTGNVYRNEQIREMHDKLNALWEQMGHGTQAQQVYAGLAEAKDPDDVVLQKASSAVNGDKFKDLYEGRWQNYYTSQSEADFALVDILAYYTQNRAQIQRMFRTSALGQRDKAQRQDYVNYMLNKCFDRMLPPAEYDGLLNQLNLSMSEKKPEEKHVEQAPLNLPKLADIYTVPPGLVGEIAQFIYAQAPRPVPEIALAGALGLMAGIVGKAYNVSNTGLNQYVLLLAATGTGKEAIARGIGKLMVPVVKSVPAADAFIGPGDIKSPEALIKYLNKTSRSFVTVLGEFGLYLQQMTAMHASPQMAGLRRIMLDLYNKSGETDSIRPHIYSDKDKNTETIVAPAVTFIGESTPERFYEGLHEGMISEGFLPRWTIIEYKGQRPDLNRNHNLAVPSFELLDKMATICSHATMLNSQNKVINVQFTKEADEYFTNLNGHCDLNIRSSEREVRKQLWNRAHVKAMKLAALVAVGIDPYSPIIDVNVAAWATEIVVADIRNLSEKFDAGEIGVDNDETKQVQTMMKVCRDYIVMPWDDLKIYAGENMAHLHNAKIIPYSYLNKKLSKVAIFRKDKRGATDSLKRAIATLLERGDIQEMGRGDMVTKYNTTARSFMIANPKVFDL